MQRRGVVGPSETPFVAHGMLRRRLYVSLGTSDKTTAVVDVLSLYDAAQPREPSERPPARRTCQPLLLRSLDHIRVCPLPECEKPALKSGLFFFLSSKKENREASRAPVARYLGCPFKELLCEVYVA